MSNKCFLAEHSKRCKENQFYPAFREWRWFLPDLGFKTNKHVLDGIFIIIRYKLYHILGMILVYSCVVFPYMKFLFYSLGSLNTCY